MKKLTILITLLINGAIIFNACKKDAEEKEFDTQTSEDNSLAEGSFNDINNIENEALSRGDSGLTTYRIINDQISLLTQCATVTVTPDSTGGTITVDFQNSNCVCHDGRIRNGIINIAYTGSYRDSGTVITTTFNNFYVGKYPTTLFKVTGTRTVTNKGRNSSGNMNFDISVDGHLTNSSGVTMDWSSTRNREWSAGSTTPYNWLDDEYKITGSAHGKNFEGNTYDVVITSPLVFKLSCQYITQGVFELTPSGKPVRTLDYGNGTCDASATVSVNGKSFVVNLR